MTILSEQFSDLEIFTARDIEICVGPYQASEHRREAMENLLSMFASFVEESHRESVLRAAQIAGFDLFSVASP